MVNIAAIGKGLKTTAEVIAAVTAVIGVAGDLKESIRPIVDSEEGQAVAGKANDTLESIKCKAAAAKDSVGDAVRNTASLRAEHEVRRAAAKEEKELAKQLKRARQMVLEGASRKTSFKEFAKERREGIQMPALAAGLYSGPGCFVVATYPGFDFDRDLAGYLYAHVGSGEALGDAIELACSRDGDPDLYADVKYKQNVRVFVYPCMGAAMEEKHSALLTLFSEAVETCD